MVELKGMSMDELAGAVHMYPWYGGARKELCRRMSRSGGESWGAAQYAGEAVYIADRRAVADLIRRGRDEDWSDRDVERILKSYIARGTQASYREEAPAALPQESPRRTTPGGDYFSAEAYESVSREEDDAVSRAVASFRSEPEEPRAPRPRLDDVFCTETLAEIYADQGYFAEAKKIYSKLLLAFPEKNAYFASLIEKLELLEKN